MNPDIQAYIENARKEGYSDADISRDLQNAGWDEGVISSNFKTPTLLVPKPSDQQTGVDTIHHSLKDAFVYSLMFLSMYILAGSMAFMLHTFIDLWMPGAEGKLDYYGWNNYAIQYSLASIIVSLPFFLGLFYSVTKRTIQNPQLKEFRFRVVLTYFTLFITFIILLWKLIETVLSMIRGNLSINFLLHLAVTAGISGLIFWYYYTSHSTKK